MPYTSRPAFGSSVGRTFGSQFSGYRGDYMVYQDEPWKLSLRKYSYPLRGTSPLRRARSVSPRRRSVNTQTTVNRQALHDILSRIDTTQEDLQALAQKVAVWSREAASLSTGLREEALLLDLGRQADELAASEERSRELQKHERVYRLSMDNSMLRQELRDLIRICKALLDQREPDSWVTDRTASPAAATRSRTQPHHAWRKDDISHTTAATAGVDTPRAPLQTRPRSALAGGSGGKNMPYFASSFPVVAQPPARAAASSYQQLSHGAAAYDTAAIDMGLVGLTDDNALYVVASDSAQADADADQNQHSSRSVPSQAAAAAAAVVAPQDRPDDVGVSSVGLVAANNALDERTLNVQRHKASGSGSGGRRTSSGGGRGHSHGAAANTAGTTAPESLASMLTFGAFLQQQQQVEVLAEVTPSVPEEWLRQQASNTAVQNINRSLVEVERELAELTADEAAATAAEEAVEAAAVVVTELSRKASDDGGAVLVSNGVTTPVKPSEGAQPAAPVTPIYQGGPYVRGSSGGGGGGGSGGGGAPSTIRREVVRPHSTTSQVSFWDMTSPLDSILLREVEKLKHINKALANTLHSYYTVTDRLTDVAMTPLPVGASRALFNAAPGGGGGGGNGGSGGGGDGGDGGGVDLASLQPPLDLDLYPNGSAAATYDPSSPSTTHRGNFTQSLYRDGTTAVVTPPMPLATVRDVTSGEPHLSHVSLLYRSPKGSGGRYIVSNEARRLDSALDSQLYAIRQQVKTLRHGMIADRVAALAGSAPGRTGAAALAELPLAAGTGDDNVGKAVVAAPSSSSYRDAVKLARLQDEIEELRREMRFDHRWYHDSLTSVVLERSTMFNDLQRRIDRLRSSAI